MSEEQPSKKQRIGSPEVEHNPLSIEDAIHALVGLPDDESIPALDQMVQDHSLASLKSWRREHKHQHSLVHELVRKPLTLAHAVQSYGFDLNQQRSSDSCTPMHLAVWYKQPETLKVLRDLGADGAIKNKYGETVAELIRVRDSCNNMVWMDLEMASLDDPTILECAVIITSAELDELARGHWVVGMTEEVIAAAIKQGTAAEFHQKHSEANGLLSEVLGSSTTKDEMETQLMALLEQHCPQPSTCPLAGSSVHCDRQCIKSEMPRVYKHLSHQIIDVSTMLSLMRRWLPSKLEQLQHSQHQKGNHRAMQDIEASLSALKWIRKHVLQPDKAAQPQQPEPDQNPEEIDIHT